MGMANPIHWEATDPDVLWSPGNVSEAIPGVSTPLNWSFVGDAIELAGRRGFAALGVLAPGEATLRFTGAASQSRAVEITVRM